MSQQPGTAKRKNASKGTVKVEPFQGRLRLRWSCGGKRYSLSLGLIDAQETRKAAEGKARQIELDILSGNFDPTLVKYKPEGYVEPKKDEVVLITCVELFQLFTDYKSKGVYSRTLEKYKTTEKYLSEFYADKKVEFLGLMSAEPFVEFLRSKGNGERILKERLGLLSACWDWGKGRHYVEVNPWKELQNRVKVPPKQMPKPFTKDEIKAIIKAFKDDPHYKHYAEFVQFLFGTGARTSEAIGLRWEHISDDFGSVWIGESLSRGVRKSTKTNKARTIPLNGKISSLLRNKKPEAAQPDDLVFTTRQGNAIDDHNFRNRAWVTILERLEILYRKPYITRHTFISHCLADGLPPTTVAAVTGHDVQTLYENYAGCVSSRPILPEMF
ncbi:site-specific integrase [Leptolyngbya sp. FACHB-261]|uniref:site-specific integrase n=1 Tax=Leptolyngbya sp. FACHB-261 TaxID=2692806 RepID=UPI0016826C45|nr:site-specific integrase [Leptolyngbya sp. FACHB-261]MBD2100104.1 tyrosine-type recombinase/integrase [Leptolyngbya sp. FACHB-261]